MKAQLQIGNEMREGVLFILPREISYADGKYADDEWYWSFENDRDYICDDETFYKTEALALAHFKSIGGIILGDAE